MFLSSSETISCGVIVDMANGVREKENGRLRSAAVVFYRYARVSPGS
jgi:hypothetical protein